MVAFAHGRVFCNCGAAESKGDAKKSRGLVDMVSHDRGVHAELARRASPGSAVGDVESPGQ